MTSAVPPVLATTWRGPVREACIRGHVVVVSAEGEVLASVGDPGTVTTARSCVKPLQALPFVARAADVLGVLDAEIAIACASHYGEPQHVEVVRSLLGRVALDETALACGPQLPYDDRSARRLLASGGAPTAVHNNCSGKHAAMLATCAVEGWPIEGYIERSHPLQVAVGGAMGALMGIDLGSVAAGIDGCGLPTFGVPITAIARAFAAGGSHAGFRRCQDAMARNPVLVSGTGRFDSVVLAGHGDRLTVKVGGAAVWAAAQRPGGPGICIKLEAGAGDAMPVVAVAVLQALDALPEPLPEPLGPFARLAQRNWAGRVVGEIRPEEGMLAEALSTGRHRRL